MPTLGPRKGAGEQSSGQDCPWALYKASATQLALTQSPSPLAHRAHGTADKEKSNVFTTFLHRCQLAAFSGGTEA